MQIAMHHLCLFSERQSTYILNPVHISLTFIFLKKKNYLFERERSHKQGDGSGAKGESDSPLSRKPASPSASVIPLLVFSLALSL